MIYKQKFGIFCVVALGALLLTACEKETADLSVPIVRPVKILTVQTADKLQTTRYPAVIQAAGAVELTFQISGLLQELPVTEAQQVKQGELVAKLDQRDFISQVDSALAQHELAEQEHQRAVRLKKGDAISQRELEQRKSQRDSAKATLDMAQKALADSELRAPYNGVIAKVPVTRLQNVGPGTTIVSMIEGTKWEASVNIPASVVASSPSRKDESAFVVMSAAPEVQIPATFVEATLEADIVSQTYAVTFSFEAPGNLVVLPGMNAVVILKSSTKQAIAGEAVVVVPLAAVLSDGQQQFIWVVDNESMAVSKRLVRVQEGIGESLVITDGLVVGESIVAAGAAYLSEGMQVRPWTD